MKQVENVFVLAVAVVVAADVVVAVAVLVVAVVVVLGVEVVVVVVVVVVVDNIFDLDNVHYVASEDEQLEEMVADEACKDKDVAVAAEKAVVAAEFVAD